jgi:tetratricopeptide (TPR) repeat protein
VGDNDRNNRSGRIESRTEGVHMLRQRLGVACWLGLLIGGCQSMPAPDEAAEPGPAGELWAQGQSAMKHGQPQQAIRYYQQSLDADPELDRNHLSLAAAYLEKGDEAGACPHLQRYVAANPHHLAARGYLAELLLRLDRPAEARGEYERFIADLQQLPAPDPAALIRCHRRLMEIAEVLEDEYSEHLNRGIGLLLLARARAGLPEPEGMLPTEGLLCKAAGELSLAQRRRPDDARPSWYLYEVWSQLPQRQPALACLHAAAAAAPFSDLTPAELRALRLACQCHALEQRLR